jgi:hypothetical protein
MSLEDINSFQEIKKTLSQYVDFIHDHNQHPIQDEENVMKCLEEIDDCKVTQDELKKTQMGLLITKLVHQERSTKISEKAKEIQLKWMDMVVEEKENTDNSKLKRKKSDSDDEIESKRVALESADGGRVHASPSHDSSKLGVSGELSDIKDSKFQGTLPEFSHRNTNQIRLFEALSVQHGKGEIKRTTRHQEAEIEKLVESVAIDLEQKIFEKYGEDDHVYAHHFRSLYTNLKDPLNSELRMNVISKKISIEDLVLKSYEELANPEVKELREDQTQEANEELILLHEVSPGVVNSADQGVFFGGNNRCSSCNSDKVYHIPDGSTNLGDKLLVACSNCGHHWKLGD